MILGEPYLRIGFFWGRSFMLGSNFARMSLSLAVSYTLATLEDSSLPRVAGAILLSP